jgi:hypothetical protein
MDHFWPKDFESVWKPKMLFLNKHDISTSKPIKRKNTIALKLSQIFMFK